MKLYILIAFTNITNFQVNTIGVYTTKEQALQVASEKRATEERDFCYTVACINEGEFNLESIIEDYLQSNLQFYYILTGDINASCNK